MRHSFLFAAGGRGGLEGKKGEMRRINIRSSTFITPTDRVYQTAALRRHVCPHQTHIFTFSFLYERLVTDLEISE